MEGRKKKTGVGQFLVPGKISNIFLLTFSLDSIILTTGGRLCMIKTTYI